jgi:catechol 2,3-dioxygenase-like lactoylglutathione lyase family enzyme
MSQAETVVKRYIEQYIGNNRAAALLATTMGELGVGLFPIVDHITVRTTDVEARASEFIDLGFTLDEKIGRLEFDDWWAQVYRKPGLPAVFIDQAFSDERGDSSVIPRWVEHFGDRTLHHVAVLVEDIEVAIAALRSRGVEFSGSIVGEPGSDLRQIFSQPEDRGGEPFTVLELAERHNGYAGFSPPQADGLMRSSAPKRA